MAKKKGTVKVVTLKCVEDGRSVYQTRRNTKNGERLELKKFNKFLRRVTLHRELKK
ncbi:MAG: 50S ribosomal protein L33 [Candidatus Woesebacteria bacterium]|jgi:large subunit ribosomal protein L33